MEPAAAADSSVTVAAGGARAGAIRIGKLLIGAALFAAVLIFAIREWREVSETVGAIGPAAMTGALVLTLMGLAFSALTWRSALGELGSHVTVSASMKIYLVGQLGKYVPGSVWALVVQMELAREAAVRRAHAVGAGVVAIGVNIVTGSALGLAVQPLVSPGSTARYVVAGVGLVGCVIVMAPPVLGRLAGFGLRLVRQPPLTRRPRWPGIVAAAAYSIASWLAYGFALSILAIGAGADPAQTLTLALPAVALAMTIGFFVVVAPSGLGVREAVLVAALAPVLDAPTALGVALVLRLVFTVADLMSALATAPIRLVAARA